MGWISIVGFFVVILPLVLTPGASFTLATQRTLAGRPRATPWVIAGTATGIYVHALLAAAGLSALVMRSSEAFAAVKIVGGVYLIGLGLHTIWQSRGGRRGPTRGPVPRPGRHPYPHAVLSNVLNPKAASIYLTLAPQFLTAQHVGAGPMLVLATVHVLTMAAWLGAWSLVLRRGRRLVRSDAFAKVVDRIGGAILIGLGVRTVSS